MCITVVIGLMCNFIMEKKVVYTQPSNMCASTKLKRYYITGKQTEKNVTVLDLTII